MTLYRGVPFIRHLTDRPLSDWANAGPTGTKLNQTRQDEMRPRSSKVPEKSNSAARDATRPNNVFRIRKPLLYPAELRDQDFTRTSKCHPCNLARCLATAILGIGDTCLEPTSG